MKSFKLFPILTISLALIYSCSEQPIAEVNKPAIQKESYDTTYSIDTRGYWENGDLVKEFDCPDSRFFVPIDIKNWEQTPVVNGRLPTYKETLNGKSIHTYGGNNNPDVKAYKIILPKLAYFRNTQNKVHTDPRVNQVIQKPELVVVIQMVQTATDTLVGFRYLTGGVGGSVIGDFHFLTEDEVKKEMSK